MGISSSSIKGINTNINPEYEYWLPYWEQMYDTVEMGEKRVKDKKTKYLSKTDGQEKDSSSKKYDNYKQRAVYINFGKRTIKKALGLLHSKPYKYTLPESLKYIENVATIDGDDVDSLVRDINTEQLTYSRCGLLIDMPAVETTESKPYIIKYKAFNILDWYEGDYGLDSKGNPVKRLAYVKLDESGNEFDFETGQWEFKYKYRILALALSVDGKLLPEPTYYTFTYENQDSNANKNLHNIDSEYIKSGKIIIPNISGKTLNKIPFVFINVTNTSSKIEMPSLYEQSNLGLAYYRGDADYRQALYYQAFALLYLIGFTEDDIKNGVSIDGYLMTNNPEAKAGYAQISGAGLQSMKMSLDDIKTEAEREGIVITDKQGVESGKALTTRMALQTSNLMELAKTCGEGILKVLKIIAEWSGVNSDQIKVIPNTDFKLEVEKAQELVNVTNVYNQGNISKHDFYEWQKDNNFTNLTWEEFDKEIDDPMTKEPDEDKLSSESDWDVNM